MSVGAMKDIVLGAQQRSRERQQASTHGHGSQVCCRVYNALQSDVVHRESEDCLLRVF
jgi:hypothetical protein